MEQEEEKQKKRRGGNNGGGRRGNSKTVVPKEDSKMAQEKPKSNPTAPLLPETKKDEIIQPVIQVKKAPAIGLLSGMNICSSCCLLIRRNDTYFSCNKCAGKITKK